MAGVMIVGFDRRAIRRGGGFMGTDAAPDIELPRGSDPDTVDVALVGGIQGADPGRAAAAPVVNFTMVSGPFGTDIIDAGYSAAHDVLVVIVSGDGGWRDIDKKVGSYLAARGLAARHRLDAVGAHRPTPGRP